MAISEAPVRRRQLSDEVASYLRQAIIAGEFAPGESVRAEHLAGRLDVSATPVREALQSLRAEGFLELAPRRGFTVAPLVSDDIRDIFTAHALIAGELAARAAVRATPGDIEDLVDIHKRLMAAADTGDHAQLEEVNHAFHRLVYRIAGSYRLRLALSTFVKYVPRAFYADIEGWPETTASDHTEVLNALVAGDPERARAAMSVHIQNSGEKLADHFGARTGTPAG
ncbi:DNA-binding GntR family transcriptional regulator [Mycolicibacterium mucogenicum 261Sha1.1M5]|nr:DNA-binding GntR family transcriptional regulator [Mycolicibacterium mucogenicum 261Sha1.1M5]